MTSVCVLKGASAGPGGYKKDWNWDFGGRALLHKRIEVGHIILRDPVVQLRLGKDKKLELPFWPPAKEAPSPQLAGPCRPLGDT